MLPRRQQSATRGRLPHAQSTFTVRRAILLALALVFVLAVYLNFQFLTNARLESSSSSHSSPLKPKTKSDYMHQSKQQNGKKTSAQQKALSEQLAYESRAVQHIVFTSGCADADFVHSEVLAHSARASGFAKRISHLVYGCSVPVIEDWIRRKNPKNDVETMGFPAITSETTMFGEGQLNTTIHPLVVHQWFKQELNRNVLKDDDFVMIVESDAVFTKNVDIWNLFREVDDIQDPRWFGQDAAWYWPKRSPIPQEQIERAVPAKSKALHVTEWREFAATGPYVVEVALLREVLPTVVDIWDKLDVTKRYMAFPLAGAHHAVPIGISGVLSVHNYPSRYENWDFVDDIKHNPCNESAGKDVELESYPITIRPQNFTLPQWIDGNEWNFFNQQIPPQFLQCDAWLMREPSGFLWYLASHTNGYERVPTILRRRHLMSVCMAVHAYNRAAVAYKQQKCEFGYNENKKIPMEFEKPTWGAAVAHDKETVMDVQTPVRYGEYKTKSVAKHLATALPGHLESDGMHFVFVTACDAAAHWQSDVLASSFQHVKQRGALTRIVTGCSPSELREVVERSSIAYPFLHVFATKNYATQTSGDAYAALNRPFGVRDWLRGANPPVNEDLVVLLDADFVFLRSIAVNANYRVTRAKDVDSQNHKEHSEVILGLRQYKRFFVYEGSRSLNTITDTVKQGQAIGQLRATQYKSVGFDAASGPNTQLCPECQRVTGEDALEYYAVGAPYVLTRTDLGTLVDDYVSLSVKRRGLDQQLALAEPIGLSLAASKHNVQFTAFANLAVFGQDSDEYWGFVDLVKQNPCSKSPVPSVIGESPLFLQGSGLYRATDKHGVEWMYSHGLMPDNLFTCDAWLLATPPPSLWTAAKKAEDMKKLRDVYGLCTSIKVMNQAIVAQRERLCPNGFNQNRKLRLVSPRPVADLHVGAVHERWEIAAKEIVREDKK
ncbi:hypothetical protein Poli38472_014282 [Pythium oligandrum]|uniref:Hydroxyproline O-arabinosyltransferase-like domain-containing protein n=1 Tax=Pythium oligandrum TaxID=41045 RepID=A0A8K1CJ37_PYTOL|nr:hypothetical protein Poli38472_014282 [Pythium oligandrum]|eukprot:TMW64165.1 hypothetical protein Poli38472_014282 [Pythium oligandrum]